MKKALRLLLTAVLIFAALPSASFAGTVTLSDSDGRMNVAYQTDGNSAYVGLDAEISEEGNNGKHQPQYYIVRNYKDAFKIDIDTGKVYIKDASKLSAENELITIRIRVTKKNKSDEMDFGINVNPTFTQVDDDEYRVIVGDVDNFYTTDVYGRIFLVDVVDKTVQYMANNVQTWSDIANDSSTVLYGIKHDGNLWKNLLENSYTYQRYIKEYWWSDGIDSLTMDDQGNMYYVEDEDLMFYNLSDNHWKKITKLMDLGYPSLGDIVFHGDKLYYAAYTNNHGIMVEVDIDRNEVEVLGNIPDNTYGLASVNDDLYLLYGTTVAKYNLDTKTYSDYMPVSGSRTIYGAAQGDAIETGNILDAVETLAYPRLATVEGQWIYRGPERIRIAGEYGSLLINYSGDFVYILDSKSVDVTDLEPGERLVDTFDFYAFNSWYSWFGWHDWFHGHHRYDWDVEENSIDIVIVPGEQDIDPENTGLHLSASDLDGDGELDVNQVEGQSVQQWHDSLGYDNTAVAQGNEAPVLVLDGINGHPAVDFDDNDYGMNIDSSRELDEDSFLNKTVATVFKTGDSVDGVQYIYEEGSIWRGYNFVIAPDSENENAPTLYAMAYNKKEWDAQDAYKVIKLATVQPETVYSAVMVQDSAEGMFRAYLNGVSIDMADTKVISSIDKDNNHPNSIGLGWFNDEAVNPNDKNEHDTSNTGGGHAFDGMIGEVYVLNKSLSFTDVQTLIGELNDKWKPDVVEAVENLSVLQSGDQLIIGWDKVSGVSNYEIILSDDAELSDDDHVIPVSNFRHTLTLTDAQMSQDQLSIFVRYKVTGVESDVAVHTHTLYTKPENFTYTPIEGEQTLFRFSNESGKTYIIRYENIEFPVAPSKGYQTIDEDSIPEPEKAELYEVATDETSARFDLGHSVKADGPLYKALDAVTGLSGTLDNDQIKLTWNRYPGAEAYEVYGGVGQESLVNLDLETSSTAQTFDLNNWGDTLFYYFKVRAKVPPTETGYVYSDFSEVKRVLTPVFANLIDSLNDQSENAQTGPDSNGYYAIGDYEKSVVDSAKSAVQTAKNALDAYTSGNASAEELQAAYDALKSAADTFDDSRVTGSNRIRIAFVDDEGNPIDGASIGDGTYTVTGGYAVFYGPQGYDELKIDISIDGYSRVEGDLLTLSFTSQPQEITLTYEDSLPSAIENAEDRLAELGELDLGPNDDGFYNTNQYHEQYYTKLLALIEEGKQLETNGASGADKNAKASEINDALEAFEESKVTSETKMTIRFRKLTDKDNADFTVGGISETVKYAPAGITVTLNTPFDAPFVDNYFKPENDTLDFTFGQMPKDQTVYFVPTDLYAAYLEADTLVNTGVEGPVDGFYALNQYEKNAKVDSGLNEAVAAAKTVLENASAKDAQQRATALSDLNEALAAFEAKRITEENRIMVARVSGETGESLGTEFYYGPEGFEITVDIDEVAHYKPYRDAGSGSEAIYQSVDLRFTDAEQDIHIIYREDVSDPVPDTEKNKWAKKALDSIKKYSRNDEIEWRNESVYDNDDELNNSESNQREYDDFLNILKNALDKTEEKYANPDFVEDYIKHLENEDKEDIETKDDLIEMLKLYYEEITNNYYSSDSNTGIIEGVKTIFYADPIDTTIVFKILDDNITDPEFHFSLIGNKYLTYDYPLIELYKVKDGMTLDDENALVTGELQKSITRVDTTIDKENDKYKYEIIVQPVSDNYQADDIYYARVITSIRVNHESSRFAEAVEDATSKDEKHRLAVEEVVDMYNKNSDEYFYLSGRLDDKGNPKKVVRINSDDLQYAIGVIRDKSDNNNSLVEGLEIISQSFWKVNGVPDHSDLEKDGLNLNMESRPALPESIE